MNVRRKRKREKERKRKEHPTVALPKMLAKSTIHDKIVTLPF